jgi:hypothetical protein
LDTHGKKRKMICKAKIRKGLRKGEPCKRKAVAGRDFCPMHGGNTPIGPGSKTYRHGRYSRYLPARLAEKYQQLVSDPELNEYRHEIALLSARADELLEAGESHLLWNRVRTAFTDLTTAMNENDAEALNTALNSLHGLIRRGYADSLRWREFYEVTERAGRMKEREHKRMAQLEQWISIDQALAFVGMLMQVITEKVTDKDTLREISRAVDAIVGQRTGRSYEGH